MDHFSFTPKRVAVRVKRKAVAAIRQGHPWLFADSVERVSKPPCPGDVAVLFDPDGQILGAGLCDPDSTVRVRIMAHGAKTPPVGPDLFDALAAEAKARRTGRIPPRTTAWRLIHGESDGFPGLVADKYDDTLVLKLYSAAFPPHVPDIVSSLRKLYPELTNVVVRLSRELAKTQSYFRDGDIFPPAAPAIRPFLENGIRFEADVRTGQKTGFFLDQRDNRSRVEALSKNRDVLNVFCFSGGFSLYAARGGAKSVTGIDFDKHATEACAKHFALNSGNSAIRACGHVEITGDAFEEMHKLAGQKRSFDLVIVDPPSFAKASDERESALRSYSVLARSAVKLLRKHGILVFASCSSRVSNDVFFPAIENAAQGCLHVFDRTGHAPDHPALLPESSYLKCLWAEKT